jgi:hypothetical protein
MKPQKRVTDAVGKAQDILAHDVEPDPRDCETTINQLMDVLDDTQLIDAVDEVKDERPEEERFAGPQQDQHARALRGQVLDQGVGRGQGAAAKTDR